MYFTYILVCLQTGRSYVGHTDNLVRRFAAHRAGSTRTTREKLLDPVVIHWEPFETRIDAARRERYFKSGAGHRLKREIIASLLPLFQESPGH